MPNTLLAAPVAYFRQTQWLAAKVVISPVFAVLVFAQSGITQLVTTLQAFPLPASAGNTTPTESTAPFAIPARCVQTKLFDRLSLIATQNLPSQFRNWDLVTFGPNSRYLFVPTEILPAAGVFRFDTVTGNVVVLMEGNGGSRTANPIGWSASNDEFQRLDPTLPTPWGSLITAEEMPGGRLFEVMNPFSSGPFQIHWRSRVPAVTHEGVRLDQQGNLYFIDESTSGSIYKFVPATYGDLSVGQTFVLSVDVYAADPNARPGQNFNSLRNQMTTRFGAATWIAMTDPAGNALTIADPFTYVTGNGGRWAADELNATPFGRPEGVAINTLANGNECLYAALTAENAVLSVELVSSTTATVRYFVDSSTIDSATGLAVGPDLAWPDNLSVDGFGTVYLCEDSLPGDFFKLVDADRDGVAESLGRIASLGVAGSEPSGFFFDPNDPYRFICTVMHPASGNDAVWSVQTRPYPGDGEFLRLLTAVTSPPATLGGLAFGAAESVRVAVGTDVITMAVDAPGGTVLGDPFVIVLQPFLTVTGVPGFGLPWSMAPMWFDPAGGTLVAASGSVGILPTAPPYGGNAVSLSVPVGLAGISVMAQGVVLRQGAGLLFSDGVECILQ